MPLRIPPPWRSVWLPRILTALALVAGLPLFLRMPVWCDLTLYDVAARTVVTGGVHYRDVFDTNMPGTVWVLVGLRWAVGPGPVAVRLADLFLIGCIVALIDRLAKWGGATPASRWWAVCGVAFVYPFAQEMAHAQRDTWMALPALAAVLLRVWRCVGNPPDGGREVFRGYIRSAAEGALWGVAVWVKPHVAIMAVAVWVLTARRLVSGTDRPGLVLAADVMGNLCGGLVVGAGGVAWLVWTGAWPYFWDVFTNWNPDYSKLAAQEYELRLPLALHWFPPWSLCLIPSVPLALLSVLDALPWKGRRGCRGGIAPLPEPAGPVGRMLPAWVWDRTAGPDARFARGVLGGLYLVWAAQAFFVQRGFVYAHVAETLLMFGLWASHRWAMPLVGLVWLAVTGGVWLVADANPAFRAKLLTVATETSASAYPIHEKYVVRHPLADPGRMRLWPECWRTDMTVREQYALMDRLRRVTDHQACISWEELGEVAEFLRPLGLRDWELIAWHDSPHPVYLMLGVKPGTRFLHTGTALSISPACGRRVWDELAATGGIAKYAVGDLEWCAGDNNPELKKQVLGPPGPHDLLPAGLPPDWRAVFPFNQKPVFRSRGGHGRYVVFELTPPLGNGP